MRGGGHDVHLGLGPAAKPLLLHSEPSGPSLSPGAHYEQRGDALWIVFPGREAKAAYMVDAAARDASNPAVVSWARQFMKLPPERRAAAILRFCQLAVRYQRDPAWHDRGGHRHGIEVLDSSAVVLFRGYGDCDAKTRLFLALCNVCGVPARLAPVFRGVDGFPHVRAEVLDERTGRWLIADPSIANSSLGHLPPHNRTHLSPAPVKLAWLGGVGRRRHHVAPDGGQSRSRRWRRDAWRGGLARWRDARGFSGRRSAGRRGRAERRDARQPDAHGSNAGPDARRSDTRRLDARRSGTGAPEQGNAGRHAPERAPA